MSLDLDVKEYFKVEIIEKGVLGVKRKTNDRIAAKYRFSEI